jgi:hypothetical protein
MVTFSILSAVAIAISGSNPALFLIVAMAIM